MSFELECMALEWLRYKCQCPLVCFERSPIDEWLYRPDVLGINKNRQLIEIEIKQSLSDFKANADKRIIKLREDGHANHYPWKYYFLVPPDLAPKVLPLLPQGAGLLTHRSDTWNAYTSMPSLECICTAKADYRAKALSLKQMVKMVMHQSATLHRVCCAIYQLEQKIEIEPEFSI